MFLLQEKKHQILYFWRELTFDNFQIAQFFILYLMRSMVIFIAKFHRWAIFSDFFFLKNLQNTELPPPPGFP